MRLDAIESKHDWMTALAYAKMTGIRNASMAAMASFGKLAMRSTALSRTRSSTGLRSLVLAAMAVAFL
jgi:hypothetical protein